MYNVLNINLFCNINVNLKTIKINGEKKYTYITLKIILYIL